MLVNLTTSCNCSSIKNIKYIIKINKKINNGFLKNLKIINIFKQIKKLYIQLKFKKNKNKFKVGNINSFF